MGPSRALCHHLWYLGVFIRDTTPSYVNCEMRQTEGVQTNRTLLASTSSALWCIAVFFEFFLHSFASFCLSSGCFNYTTTFVQLQWLNCVSFMGFFRCVDLWHPRRDLNSCLRSEKRVSPDFAHRSDFIENPRQSRDEAMIAKSRILDFNQIF